MASFLALLVFSLMSFFSTGTAQPSCPSTRFVTFFAPWGSNSWLVNYTGPFLNDRPPHVEVGPANMKNLTKGETHCLENLAVAGKSALEWTVDGVYNSLQKAPAHFTCYYGPNPASELPKYK